MHRRDGSGRTAADWAWMKGHSEIEKTLLIWAASHAPQGEFSIDGDAVHAANISAADRLKLIEAAGHKARLHVAVSPVLLHVPCGVLP